MRQSRMTRRAGKRMGMTAMLAVAGAGFLLASGQRLTAQGCVAAHTAQPLIEVPALEIDQTASVKENGWRGLSLHGLTVTVGFRTYSSFRHYVGTVYQVQREIAHNEVQNHVDLYDLSFNYQLTPRWSVIGDVPGMTATRHSQGSNPLNTYRSGGIGDVTIGAQGWLLRPPTEGHGNVAVSASVKLPTGINDAKGTTFAANGAGTVYPFDESIQPGDGTWGFSLATQAYKETYFHTTGYFSGSWLFSPADVTGVYQNRKAPGENVISATDQYLWRGGASHAVPLPRVKRVGVVLSFGGRMEGVPVRDAFGKSDGFRRPGYVISVEPGLAVTHGRSLLSVSGPWAIERNRKTSVTDYANHSHGDAAFSDYTVIASLTRSF